MSQLLRVKVQGLYPPHPAYHSPFNWSKSSLMFRINYGFLQLDGLQDIRRTHGKEELSRAGQCRCVLENR